MTASPILVRVTRSHASDSASAVASAWAARGHQQAEGDAEAADAGGRGQPRLTLGEGASLGEHPSFLSSHLVDEAAHLLHHLLAHVGRHDASRRLEAQALTRRDRGVKLVELAPDQPLQRDETIRLRRYGMNELADSLELERHRSLRRVVGRQVASIAGDDEPALPRLGVFHEREKDFRLLAQHQGTVHRLVGLAQLHHPPRGDPPDEDEYQAAKPERTDAEPSCRPDSHEPPAVPG